jgi:hypothetical protein
MAISIAKKDYRLKNIGEKCLFKRAKLLNRQLKNVCALLGLNACLDLQRKRTRTTVVGNEKEKNESI